MATGLIFRPVRKISKSDYKTRYDARLKRTTRLPLEGFFSEICYLSISLKYVEKIQVSFNDVKNNWYYTYKQRYTCMRAYRY